MSVVLNPDGIFPSGTAVKVFTRSEPKAPIAKTGAPEGSEVASATVAANGSLTLSSLESSGYYTAYASVAGIDTYLKFTVSLAVDGAYAELEGSHLKNSQLPTPVVNSSTAAFNVKNYGAIGDGSAHPLSGIYGTLGAAQAVYPAVTSLSQELDWAAAQKAIEAATAAKGGVVFFPAGFYQIGTRLTIPVNTPIKLLGAGFGYIGGQAVTVLVRPTSGDYLIYAVGSEAEALNENNPAHRIHLEIEEMKLDGGFQSSPLFRLRFGSECYFHHVRFHNANHNLVWATQLYNSVFSACYFTAGGNGTTNPAVLLDAPTGTLNNGASNTVQFVGCEWESNTGTDLEITGSENSACWVNVTNFKMEREKGAFPFVHFGHAIGCSLGDGSIHMGTESNEVLVVNDGTTLAGDGGVVRPNRLSSVHLSSFSEPEYMVSHTHGQLSLSNVAFNATVIKTAFIHVGSEVGAGAFKYAALASTNEPRLIYDQSAAGAQNRTDGFPGAVAPSSGGWMIGTQALSAKNGRLCRLVPLRNIRVKGIGYAVTTIGNSADQVDVGIYNEVMTERLGSNGGEAGKLAATGPHVVELSAPVWLQAGVIYYIALTAGSLTGAPVLAAALFAQPAANQIWGSTAGLYEVDSIASIYPLPTSLTPGGGTSSLGYLLTVHE